MVVADLLDLWEILFGRVEVVDRYIIHGDVHYRAVVPDSVARWEEVISDRRRLWAAAGAQHRDVTRRLLLDLLARLEDWRQQRLALHKGAVKMAFVAADDAAGIVANAVLEVGVERLVPAAVNLEVGEVATGMLRRKRALLHVDNRVVVFLLLLFWEAVINPLDQPALVRTVGCVLRKLAHALSVG